METGLETRNAKIYYQDRNETAHRVRINQLLGNRCGNGKSRGRSFNLEQPINTILKGKKAS